MLKDRLQSAAVLIAVLVVLLYADAKHTLAVGLEGSWLLPALLFFALGTAWELSGLLKTAGYPVSKPLTLVVAGMVSLSPCVPMLWTLVGATYPVNCPIGNIGWITIAAAVGVFLVFLSEIWTYESERPGSIERILLGSFAAAYVGIPLAMLVLIRRLHCDVSATWGLWAVVTVIAVTKSADAGAYFAGKAFGKNKLIPKLSPGKTVEGVVGGVLTATIVAFVCLWILIPSVPSTVVGTTTAASDLVFPALTLGSVLTIAGLVGDLSESLIKRVSGAKDSGKWLRGLGGVWDVSDSLLAASTPAFVLFASGLADK